MPDLGATLAANLKVLRRRWAWSQADLARRSGLSAGYVSDLELARRWPRPEVLEALAGAFHISAVELLLNPLEAQWYRDALERRDLGSEIGEALRHHFEKPKS